MDDMLEVYLELFPEERNKMDADDKRNKMNMDDIKRQLEEAKPMRPMSKKTKQYWIKRFKEEGLSDSEIENRWEGIEMYNNMKKQFGPDCCGYDGHDDAIYLNDGMYILSDGRIEHE